LDKARERIGRKADVRIADAEVSGSTALESRIVIRAESLWHGIAQARMQQRRGVRNILRNN
jgi:hypothetical protein